MPHKTGEPADKDDQEQSDHQDAEQPGARRSRASRRRDPASRQQSLQMSVTTPLDLEVAGQGEASKLCERLWRGIVRSR